MKFPKSLHADGWADHIDTTKSEAVPGVPSGSAAAHLHGAKAPGIRINSPRVAPALSSTRPVMSTTSSPLASATRDSLPPAAARPEARAVALPPQRQRQLSWLIAAGTGAAVIAIVAIWAANRPADMDIVVTQPAIISGTTVPQAEVAAATPVAVADAVTTRTTTAAATPAVTAPAPALMGLPVTTVKPAVESGLVAQATVPAPRPDLVVRGAPRTLQPQPQPQPQPTPYLQPSAALSPDIAAAPGSEPQPPSVSPGSEPIALPPTAAGTSSVPQETQPAAAPAAAVVPAPVALAQVAPVFEDGGITLKVRSAIAADSTLAGMPIVVSTDRGVVKLEGQAPDAPTRERATVVAAATTGVKSVDNRLTVPAAPMLSQATRGL